MQWVYIYGEYAAAAGAAADVIFCTSILSTTPYCQQLGAAADAGTVVGFAGIAGNACGEHQNAS